MVCQNLSNMRFAWEKGKIRNNVKMHKVSNPITGKKKNVLKIRFFFKNFFFPTWGSATSFSRGPFLPWTRKGLSAPGTVTVVDKRSYVPGTPPRVCVWGRRAKIIACVLGRSSRLRRRQWRAPIDTVRLVGHRPPPPPPPPIGDPSRTVCPLGRGGWLALRRA